MDSLPITTTSVRRSSLSSGEATKKTSNCEHDCRQSEEEFQADVAKALAESIKAQSRRQASKKNDFIFILDDSDSEDEGDTKISAKINRDTAALKRSFTAVPSALSGPTALEGDDYNHLNEAMRRSLEESVSNIKRPLERVEVEDNIIPHNICRKLSRQEFHQTVDEFVHEQGGYDKIESGQMVKHGNANDMKKSCIAYGGGNHQTGAQYGRYSIGGMWRVFDVLEGKDDIFIDDNLEGKSGQEDKQKEDRGDGNRLIGLPGAKITAFVDIGHGIGIQVLQAGWSLGVPARGVEIMKDRHVVAVSIKDGVIESLRSDPPNSTAVELRLADFSHAIVLGKKTARRDEELHSYLLFKDKPNEIQEGLVIFVNNAEDVMAARSNQNAKGICLDAHLANMFAQMQIGGRMVTLTDISCHLTQSTEWFRHDIFDSGTDAISWGNKSVDVHILTKLSHTWYCQSKKCDYMKYAKSSCQEFFSAAPNDVVNEFGELNEKCVYCEESARRCSRLRNQPRKRKK